MTEETKPAAVKPTPKRKVSKKQDEEVQEKLSSLRDVTVRVKPDETLPGATFYDPEQKVNIRSEFVTVKRTAFVSQKLNNGELEEK